MKDPEQDSDLSESKTKRKKQMLMLQKIGETLVALSDAQLAQIPLDPPLAEAVAFARTLSNHEAKRRQLQYIGKLMRHVDAEPIQQAIEQVQLKSQKSKAIFHQIERWRDKLISEGDNQLQEFLKIYPAADRQQLRQLIRKAQQETLTEKNRGASTELFRLLKNILSV